MKRAKTIQIKNKTYQFEGTLGKGAYAKVYSVKELQTGKMFAIKRFKYDRKLGASHDIVRELDILSRYYMCPNIVTIHGFKWTKTDLFILLEHGDMNLKEFIRKYDYSRRFEWFPLIACQLINVVAFMHKNNVSHRDLKPENILVKIVDDQPHLLLCDFGITKKMKLVHNTPKVTTLWYRAPENLLKLTKYNESIDIWSVGCVLYEYLYDKVLFRGDNREDMLQRIFAMVPKNNISEIIDHFSETHSIDIQPILNNNNLGLYHDDINDSVYHKVAHADQRSVYNDFIFGMLTIDSRNRLSAKELLSDFYFQYGNQSLSPTLPDKYDYVHSLNYDKNIYPKNNIEFKDYLVSQNSDIINKYYRQSIVGCIVDICKELGLKNNTIFLCIDIFDRYLAIHHLKEEFELKYIVFASILIAIKYFEITTVDIATLENKSSFLFDSYSGSNRHRKTDSNFSANLYSFEKAILLSLNFNIFRSNIYTKTRDFDLSLSVMSDYDLRKIDLKDITGMIYYMQKIGLSNTEKIIQFIQ